MKEKLGSILLVMLLIFSMMQISVFPIYAATVSDDWLYRDGSKSGISASFDTSTGVLTISGTCEMPFYDWLDGSTPPWKDYREDITSVIINNGVKNISRYAFTGCTNMKIISIPSSVISIGEAAFGGCSKLTSITLPSSITEIAFWAFDGCDSLENIYFEGNAPSVYAAESGWVAGDGYWTNTASFDKDLVILHYLSGKSGWTSPRWEGYKTATYDKEIPLAIVDFEDNKLSIPWSLNYFDESAEYYNSKIATAGLALINAMYKDTDGLTVVNNIAGKGFYQGSTYFKRVTKNSEALGFDNIRCYGRSGTDFTSIFHAIGSQKVTLPNDETYHIIEVVLRGTNGEEWLSTLGFTFDSVGDIEKCVSEVEENIQEYIKDYIKDGENVKFFITGHSRGGAAADLLGYKLTNAYNNGTDNVFVYAFASLNTEVYKGSSYQNIINISNTADVAPYYPLFMYKHGRIIKMSRKDNTIFNDKYKELTGKSYGIDTAIKAHSNITYMALVLAEQIYSNKGFVKVLSVKCPVDVEVYDGSGDLAANIVSWFDGDDKYFILPAESEYTIELIGTDNGIMEYTITEWNNDFAREIVYRDVPLNKGIKYSAKVNGEIDTSPSNYNLTSSDGTIISYSYITGGDDLNSASDWAREGIKSAIAKGFVPVELQSSYKNIITRAEFCRMAVKWVEYATGKSIGAVLAEKGVSRNLNAFTDTKDSDILAAFALGITNGTGNNQFTPNGQFTREQAATMIMNTCNVTRANVSNSTASGFADLNTASNWAVDGINFVRAYGIMQGTGNNNFSPKLTYTREQSILTFDNIEPEKLINSTPTITPAKMGTVTIEYDFNGGFGQAPSHKVIKDKDGIAVYYLTESIPIRDGYEFLGWRFEDSLHYGIDNPGDDITFDLGNPTTSEILTYYAQWEPIRQTQTASVSFSNMKAYWLDGNFYFSCDYIADGNVTKTGFTMTTRGGSRTISSDSNLSSDAYTMSNPYIRNGVDTSGGWKYDETYSWTAFAIVDGKRVESQTQSFIFSSPSGL